MKIENFKSVISNKANNCTSMENGKWKMENSGIFIWFILFKDGSFANKIARWVDWLLAYFVPIVENWDPGNPG